MTPRHGDTLRMFVCGELLLHEIREIPREVRRRYRATLCPGHRVEGATVWEDREDNLFLHVPWQAVVEHHREGPVSLPIGTWQVLRARPFLGWPD
ncbi:MAG: hypothetical protein ACYCW6_22010 [Candidatus Xenobia bacterium]